MKKPTPKRLGRPRRSPLTRAEQLRQAKRVQRERERRAGRAAVELLIPAVQAKRLRIAARTPQFGQLLEAFLQDVVIDLHAWPTLRELAWSRKDRWIPAADALALYERNWRHVEPARLTSEEAALIDRLKSRFGGGVLHA